MEKNITKQIRDYVEKECRKPTSLYGYEPFSDHFVPVHKYAKILAQKAGADVEIVEIAAWLHDIGSIIYGRKEHHITGARIAVEKLASLNYPPEKIQKVAYCIKCHRGSQKIKREILEAKILAEADAMSHFDNIAGIFRAAFVFEKQNRSEANESVKNKLKNSWNKLSPGARSIIKLKYKAAMLLLN